VEHWWNAMNAATQKVIEKVIDAVASTDGSITPDQRDAALAILNGHIPQQCESVVPQPEGISQAA
jgi:hypothetical protein